jgi:uncharacterized protein YciI
VFIVELTFTDEPGRLEARGPHRELVARLHDEGKIVMAGPFADESGALLVFDVADERELDELLAADPYQHQEVHVSRRQEWKPIVP